MPTNSPDTREPGSSPVKRSAEEIACADRSLVAGAETPRIEPVWKQLYQAAILEMDAGKIMGRIADAEQAIVERGLALQSEPSGNPEKELGALAYCANFLAELRRLEKVRAAGANLWSEP